MAGPSTPKHVGNDLILRVTPSQGNKMQEKLEDLFTFLGSESDTEVRGTMALFMHYGLARYLQSHGVEAPPVSSALIPRLEKPISRSLDTTTTVEVNKTLSLQPSGSLQAQAESATGAERDKRKATTGRRRDARRDRPEGKLKAVTVSVSQQADTITVNKSCHDYFQALIKLEVPIMRDNKREITGFSENEAAEITNFFFSEMMGEKAWDRLEHLIADYSSYLDYDLDRGAAARAEIAAKAEANPDVRRFFEVFAQSQRIRSPSRLAGIHQIQLHMDLLEQYNRLSQLMADDSRNTELLDELKKKNLTTSRGVSKQSLIVRYLANSLNITTITLQNVCQAAQGVTVLTKEFGPGILVVLPNNVMQKLNKWGNQRMSHAITMLKDVAPFIQPVSEALKGHIYNPIIKGQPLRLQNDEVTRSETSFLDLIISASGVGHDQVETTPEDVELMDATT